MTITIQPDHLDVEHELELRALPSWNSTEFPNNLEIFGDLTMQGNTAFTGLLLWNGEKILKGKLQTRDIARRKYEEVVDRNVKNPPPPRDPALLEKVNEAIYRLSVFPVTLNQSRKIRLRYLIPSQYMNGSHCMPFPFPFSAVASVTLKGGSDLKGYSINSLRRDWTMQRITTKESVQLPIALDPEPYSNFSRWTNFPVGKMLLHSITPLFEEKNGSRMILASSETGLWKGWSAGFAAHFFLEPPKSISDIVMESDTRIVARIRK